MVKQKAYLLLENLHQLQNLNSDFVALLLLFGLYLFKLMDLLKPDFNYSGSLHYLS